MIAVGMEILFALFGLFIGFGMYQGQAANPWSGVSAWSTIWYLVTAGWSMFFGAWCAARLSSDPLTGDGMLHGVTTWGLATTITIAFVALASWAVLKEGINMLGTAAIAAEQVAGPAVAQAAPGGMAHVQANTGQIAQATADIISRLSLRIFVGVIVGFITALIGGWLGRSRAIVVAPADVVPVPTRRAA
jgi:hypothetical protein